MTTLAIRTTKAIGFISKQIALHAHHIFWYLFIDVHGSRITKKRNPKRLPFVWKNPEIPGGIQMERFILVEIFREKSNTFQSITFFPFLPKRPKFSALLVPGFMSREREKFKENFHRNFRTNGKRCLSDIYTKEHEISKKKSNGSRHSVYQSLMKCRLSFEAMYGFSTHFSSFI